MLFSGFFETTNSLLMTIMTFGETEMGKAMQNKKNIPTIIMILSSICFVLSACNESSVYFIDNEVGIADSKIDQDSQQEFSYASTENISDSIVTSDYPRQTNSLDSCQQNLQSTIFSTGSQAFETKGISTNNGFFMLESFEDHVAISSFQKTGEKLFTKILVEGILEIHSILLQPANIENQFHVIFNARWSENNPFSSYHILINDQAEIIQGIEFVLPASITRGKDSYVQEFISSNDGILIRWMQQEDGFDFSHRLTYLKNQNEIQFDKIISAQENTFESSIALSGKNILVAEKSSQTAQTDLVLETLREDGSSLKSIVFHSSSQASQILQLLQYKKRFAALFSETVNNDSGSYSLIKLAIFNNELSKIEQTIMLADSREFSEEGNMIASAQAIVSNENILSLVIEQIRDSKKVQVLLKQIDLHSFENTQFTTIADEVNLGSRLLMQNNAVVVLSSSDAGFVVTAAQCDAE